MSFDTLRTNLKSSIKYLPYCYKVFVSKKRRNYIILYILLLYSISKENKKNRGNIKFLGQYL